MEAGRRLGPGAAALVFASARNPGGGFLRGTKAQEEDIARASALYECLRSVPEFYTFHRASADLRYSDRVIYSPDVPVFRRDDARLDHPDRLRPDLPNVRRRLRPHKILGDAAPGRTVR